MKKILITGSGSYIGDCLVSYLAKFGGFMCDTLDMRDEAWRRRDFSQYDTVFHVAGIAHVSADPKMESLYYKVNRDLAVETANKAKTEGVKQFIFMSSIIIYGADDAAGGGKVIDTSTEPNPDDFYGKSKHEADKGVFALRSEAFAVTVIRSPVVYGSGCKGNFPKLLGLAKKAFIFPNIENARSMIYIDNLCEFVRLAVEGNFSGIFFPQNSEYVSTKNVIAAYRKILGKKTLFLPFPKPFVKLFSKINAFNKAFGTKIYDKTMSDCGDYRVVSFEQSIEKMAGRTDERRGGQANDILVSIVTVSYNSEKTISGAIESVLNQTYPNIEYIIIDGASKDNTVQIAQGFAEQFAQKGIKYAIVSEKDDGIYHAMNKGITMSTGEVVGMINSDDWYEPFAVEKVAEKYGQTGFDLLFGDLRIHKKDSVIIKHSKLGRVVTSRHWNHPTSFIAKRVYNQRMYDCESMYDDFDMYIRLRREKRNIVVLNEILANFRMGGVSNEKKISKAWERVKNRYRIYRKNGYSPLYFFECLLIEGAKFILS